MWVGVAGCTELRAGSADCSALRYPGLLPGALLSRARAAGSVDWSQLSTARFLPQRQALSPLARTSPAELSLKMPLIPAVSPSILSFQPCYS